MGRLIRRILVLVTSMALLVSVTNGPAHASHGANFFNRPWYIEGGGVYSHPVPFYWGHTMPSSLAASRARVRDGFARWNRGQSFLWVEAGDLGYYPGYDDCSHNYQRNVVQQMNIDGWGGRFAETRACMHPVFFWLMSDFVVVFDPSEFWYTGTGTPPPFPWVDLWGVAAHESGHGAGFWGGPGDPWEGHWDPNASICSNNPSPHTMCPTPLFANTAWRTLETHEVTAFDARY